MSPLVQEAHVMQNPALGALLLWRFTTVFSDFHPQKDGPPLPVAFLVLPLVWHLPTVEVIESTQQASGLRKFAGKFSEADGARDVMLAVNERMIRWRAKTHASLRVAFATGLLSLSSDARLELKLKANETGSNRTVKGMTDAAEKLGAWLALLSVHEISLILHVEF